MKMVTLRNGAQEAEVLVTSVMKSLNKLMSDFIGTLQAYDLYMICRQDPSYRKYLDNEKKLQELNLLNENGQPPNLVRNVVLSAFQPDGLELKLVSPVAAQV